MLEKTHKVGRKNAKKIAGTQSATRYEVRFRSVGGARRTRSHTEKPHLNRKKKKVKTLKKINVEKRKTQLKKDLKKRVPTR